MSSSEEQEVLHSPNPFSTARRSKKYTSKKSYKEYLRPHNNNNNGSSTSNKSTNATATINANLSPSPSSQQKDFLNSSGSDKNNNTIGARGSNSNIAEQYINGKEIGVSKSSNCGGAAKFSLIMNDIHGIKQHQKQQSCDDTHSLKINRMHGISLTKLNITTNEEKETSHINNGIATSSPINEKKHNQSAIKVTVGDDKKEHHCNNNNMNNNNNNDDAVITRKYCDEELEMKQKIATRDDWYISDIEENDTTLGVKSPYSNVSGVSNSVLECVNQILLQQSMDEYIETQNETKPKDSQNSAPTRSNKRVHFSTKNSMVQIKPLPPRHHHSPPPSSNDDTLNSTYENQSTYSNEYELIGSSRTYVDMDTKSTMSMNDGFKPKLPPKPGNLMKLQQIAKQRQFVQDQIFCNKKTNSDYELNESEPDYASISEIQDTIKSVKVVTAEIHNDADNLNDNEYSEIKEVPTPTAPSPLNIISEDDSFADVPKLPNVYSIIPGIEPTTPTSPTKKTTESTNKCIGNDNYITKSPMKKKLPIAFAIKKDKEKSSSSILAEINNSNKKQQSPSSLKKSNQLPPPVPIKHQQTIKIIDEKIQQEFDWYNLDAEYTKTDIVITPQIENIEEMYQFDDETITNGDDDDGVVKVEYNLEDFEYEPSGNGIEIETNNNNFTTVIKINESSSSTSSTSSSSSSSSNELKLPSPVRTSTTASLLELAETPKIDYKKSNKIRYDKFLKESGLISKSLLASKKKFYAGSFV